MAKNTTYTAVSVSPNNQKALIVDSLSEANNAIVADPGTRRTDIDKTGGETLAAYNLRVSPGKQPTQPGPVSSYQGKTL